MRSTASYLATTVAPASVPHVHSCREVWHPREVSKRSSSKDEWEVAVHLNDGRLLYLCEDGERQGQPWGPRVSQARRFPTNEDAQRYAAACLINASARRYEAVRLAPNRI